MRVRRLAAVAAIVALSAAGVTSRAEATHSWGGYHWARTSNPFTLKLGDNVTSAWDAYLVRASSDWSQSGVLHTTVPPGNTNGRLCRGTAGTVQVCNSTYGSTGWLGIASISITGGVHITQGTVKLNDTYFNTAQYNTPAWRAMVTCQEIGHTFGLDHQDTTFTNINLGTCMDYTNSPSGDPTGDPLVAPGLLSNEHPNQHDYQQLATIYTHLDGTSTVTAATVSPGSQAETAGRGSSVVPGEWGRLVAGSEDPRHVAVYERDFGGGDKEVTFVIWA